MIFAETLQRQYTGAQSRDVQRQADTATIGRTINNEFLAFQDWREEICIKACGRHILLMQEVDKHTKRFIKSSHSHAALDRLSWIAELSSGNEFNAQALKIVCQR